MIHPKTKVINHIDHIINIFIVKKFDHNISLSYINKNQTRVNYFILDVFVEEQKIKTYEIIFMDTYGYPEKDLMEEQFYTMVTEINNFFNLNLDYQYLFREFSKKFHTIIIGTAFKRREDLLDFDNPKSWINE